MSTTKRNLFLGGGAAVLGVAVVALASTPAKCQDPAEQRIAQAEERLERAQERLAEMQARLEERLERAQEALTERLQDRATRASLRATDRATQEAERQMQRVLQSPDSDSNITILAGDEGASWLGVESQDVNADRAKELKLPAERGVLLGRIVPDSPAAKAGLKENDVITEINGQRVEGEAQFRRMIHEIPAGRTAQFTVWRDGRAQSISVTLGKSEERSDLWLKPGPNSYSFQLPRVEIPDLQVYPDGNFGEFSLLPGGRGRLGIDAEDLGGQFGAYFGAPDGEGVLVREVGSGSPAEKAGMKSGDVITALDGERIRSLGDLREKLAAKRDEKTVKLGVLRNKSEMTLTVELPPPPSKTPQTFTHRTNI
jgi:serine protease Do